MKRYLFTILFCLTLAGPVSAGDFIHLAGEIQLPLPGSWQLGSDSLDYPFQLVRFDPSAELLIFKSEISPEDAVQNKDDLRQSVKMVVDDVILTLPDAMLLTSTGYFEDYRTGFMIEFTSTDSVNHIPLRHRLNGVLYRHPDGQQLLFTLWAKAGAEQYPEVVNELKLIQGGFVYAGAQKETVFTGNRRTYWYIAVLLMLVAGLFYVFRRRPQHWQHSFSPSETNHWQCQCGRLNESHIKSCKYCGQSRSGSEVGSNSIA